MAQFRGGRAPDLTAEFDPTVLSNATLANHDDLDTDIFFDTYEVFVDDVNVKKADDHELNGNEDPSPGIPSRFLPRAVPYTCQNDKFKSLFSYAFFA